MTFVSNTVETGLTRLTEALLAKQAHYADTVVCAQGKFYRAEVRLEPIDPEALAEHMVD
ncbi:hypothetical protein [Vreelandella arcis]|uniref:Uncharacterized protein n=1 Tax=Vreelandella arcis TaxID=416873 RepID=A0A1G9X0H8_9GAMM|nr:hypothetical protein [Halomonas arcis]SDM90207.1 hypothetical protein SAMN04487951_10180 [Halomonas arcis]